MTLKDLKADCEAAVITLCWKHGYSPDDFTPADGDEALDAPGDLDKQFQRNGFIKSILPGTLLHWYRCSYEYDEWDAQLPTHLLSMVEFDWEGAIQELELAAPEKESAK